MGRFGSTGREIDALEMERLREGVLGSGHTILLGRRRAQVMAWAVRTSEASG